jgi:hypothetical protein
MSYLFNTKIIITKIYRQILFIIELMLKMMF